MVKQSLFGAVAIVALASAAGAADMQPVLKLHMGDRTLQQTDRTGARLDIISPLANPSSPLMFGPPQVAN